MEDKKRTSIEEIEEAIRKVEQIRKDITVARKRIRQTNYILIIAILFSLTAIVERILI